MRMRVLHVRFDAPLVDRLERVRAAVEEVRPAVAVSDASLIREAVDCALSSPRFLRTLGLPARRIAAVARRS